MRRSRFTNCAGSRARSSRSCSARSPLCRIFMDPIATRSVTRRQRVRLEGAQTAVVQQGIVTGSRLPWPSAARSSRARSVGPQTPHWSCRTIPKADMKRGQSLFLRTGHCPQAGDCRADVLPLEETVWRPGGFRGSGAEAASGGEPQAQAPGGRFEPGQGNAAGSRLKKMVGASQRRSAVRYLTRRYSVSERRGCAVTGTSRSTYRYQSKRPSQEALRQRIRTWRTAGSDTGTSASMFCSSARGSK